MLDLIPSGRPRNSTKKDVLLWIGGGFGGGGLDTLTGSDRYTFWIDHNPFATAIKQLIAQNVSFEIFSDAAGTIPVALYCRIEQSNDCPPEILTLASEVAAGRTLQFTSAQLPPYFITTKFLTNPADFNYQNDQGRYVYNAYNGNGFGLAKTGSFDAIFQSFVPQSPTLTGVWLNRLFRIGSTSDHTLYSDITVNLYDSNLNLVGVIGKLKKNYPLVYGNNPPVTSVDYNTVYFVTADDGHQYWNDLNQIHFIPDKPLPTKVGATYYIGVMPDTYGAAFNYGIGANTDTSGNYNNNGRYIFGQAFTAVKSGGVFTSVSAIGSNLSICFVSQRNIGRTAYTYYWGNAGYYWNDPAVITDQFKFVKEDFDQRI